MSNESLNHKLGSIKRLIPGNAFWLCLILFFAFKSTMAQIGVGEWRDHLPYTFPRILTESPTKIYTASENGVFSYHKQNNSIEKLTKVNILSDIGISAINYSSENQTLVVGYSNGNVDLIFDKIRINIPDIKREMINGSKAINDILFIAEYAYLSCGFGIVVINLQKQEIKETYIIGDLGAQIRVNQVVYENGFLYAATIQGVYIADYKNPNLIDYSYWERIMEIPNPTSEFNQIYVKDNNMLVSQVNESFNDALIQYKDGVWGILNNSYASIRKIKSKNSIQVVTNRNIINYNSSFIFQDSISKSNMDYLDPYDVVLDAAGTFWIANNGSGLTKYKNGASEDILPNAPYTANAFNVDAQHNKVLVVGGGVNAAWNNSFLNGTVFSFQNEQWRSNIDYTNPDYVVVKIDPQNTEHYFIGSWGGGLLEFRNDQLVETFNEGNSSLQTMISGSMFYRVGGLAFDQNNNLWMTNYGVPEPISVKKSGAPGDWKSFSFDGAIKNLAISDIIVTQSNHKWAILPNGNGLFVFDNNQSIDDENDDLYKKLSIIDENGKIITNNVVSIAEDLDGDIWVGTNMGIVVYYNPTNVFEEESFYARRISLTIGELTQYLLNTEVVTAIAVDGANRKWLGTQSSGVYLVSKNGTEEINHFTQENSPLLSNRINDIGINHETGEVFFATDKGLISYRGTATMGSDEFRDVYVYPNPVRENYFGDITIRGLVSDVNVKITDISGNIVYETNADGGQATWDGKNFSGRRVSTGVYLVFCTNDDGSKTHITKLLFIK